MLHAHVVLLGTTCCVRDPGSPACGCELQERKERQTDRQRGEERGRERERERWRGHRKGAKSHFGLAPPTDPLPCQGGRAPQRGYALL